MSTNPTTPTLLPVGTSIYYFSLSTTADTSLFLSQPQEPEQFDLAEGEYCISEVSPGDTDASSSYSLTLISSSSALCTEALLTPSYLGKPFSHVTNKRLYFGCWALSLSEARHIVREYLFTWASKETQLAHKQYENRMDYCHFVAQDGCRAIPSDQPQNP